MALRATSLAVPDVNVYESAPWVAPSTQSAGVADPPLTTFVTVNDAQLLEQTGFTAALAGTAT